MAKAWPRFISRCEDWHSIRRSVPQQFRNKSANIPRVADGEGKHEGKGEQDPPTNIRGLEIVRPQVFQTMYNKPRRLSANTSTASFAAFFGQHHIDI